MLKTTLLYSFLILLVIFICYLIFAPINANVPAWDAPKNMGYSGDFAENELLGAAQELPVGEHIGPEDLVLDAQNRLYTGTYDGWILRTEANSTEFKAWVKLDGRPLGLAIDAQQNLIIGDALKGVIQISPDKKVSVLVDQFEGKKFKFVDDVEVMPDGSIYFSDASTFFDSQQYGVYKASALDIIAHGAYGRIYRYDPQTQTTQLILKDLNFVNGISLSHDKQSLLFIETGSYNISRYWLEGEKKGQVEELIANLPGLPDNIKLGQDGLYWIGLVIPRNPLLDMMSDKPWLRKAVMRLNKLWVIPSPPRTQVIAINESGDVIHNLQDSSGKIPEVPTALETDDGIYLSSLSGDAIGFLKKPFAEKQP